MTDSTSHDSMNDPDRDSSRNTDNTHTLTQVYGTVKWFDPRKGFGFIIGPDEQDIFVHFTVIEGEGFRVLKDGVTVCYDAEENEKGWRATKIYPSDSQAEEFDSDAPEVVIPKRTYSRTPRR